MNAIPSALIVGPAGWLGLARGRDVAIATEPHDERRSSGGGPLGAGSQLDHRVPSVAARTAKKAARGALDARPAQGRVGEISRHIAPPLAPHRLLSATASARPDPPRSDRAGSPCSRHVRRGGLPTSRSQARTIGIVTPPRLLKARAGALNRPLPRIAAATVERPFRGKGVRAA